MVSRVNSAGLLVKPWQNWAKMKREPGDFVSRLWTIKNDEGAREKETGEPYSRGWMPKRFSEELIAFGFLLTESDIILSTSATRSSTIMDARENV